MALEAVTTVKDLIHTGRQAEADQDYAAAAEFYEKAIKADPLLEPAYDRLMIVYRKLKDHKKELRIIKDGIKAYEKFFKSRGSKSRKVADISNKLSISMGLTDKKGNTIYEPQPIAKWKKRQLAVEKKIK